MPVKLYIVGLIDIIIKDMGVVHGILVEDDGGEGHGQSDDHIGVVRFDTDRILAKNLMSAVSSVLHVVDVVVVTWCRKSDGNGLVVRCPECFVHDYAWSVAGYAAHVVSCPWSAKVEIQAFGVAGDAIGVFGGGQVQIRVEMVTIF